ncbi:GPI transamidase component [Pleurotus ostreatus]|uniref:GPI transamidase component n=1 Tax=Pleurotus ostreatus TaxID=5322 RepID=A0A8H6ZR94_PLEOS|nr:GPI transamidase component [Pleurotus ostreatus]KAF7426157.1 GPI transamidase component [Pleurotus ostreatus]
MPLREPSTIFFQSDNVRRTIIASYWIIIILALPLWWKTTSIERLSLPSSRVRNQASKALRLPVHIQLPGSYLDTTKRSQDQLAQTLSKQGVDVVFTGGHIEGSNPTYILKHATNGLVLSDRELEYDFSDESKLSTILSELLCPPQQGHVVAPYSPRFRLSFTLLNEDSTSGNYVRSWDVSRGIRQYITPLLDQLSLLHNFTIESQVQYHAPLAFKPRPTRLSSEDLSVFVNSAEWSLCDQPLEMPESFLLPQWGGIVVHDPPSLSVDDIFPIFARQLLSLLGVSPLPVGVKYTGDVPISRWQLEALLRRRTLENTHSSQDTLRSIVTLVDQIEGMPVGWNVKDDILDALDALDKVYASSSASLRETVKQSTDAIVLASRAFFNPDMLALLYFPAEHKYAVYAPLFASAVIPVIAAAVRELLAWRRQRRQQT